MLLLLYCILKQTFEQTTELVIMSRARDTKTNIHNNNNNNNAKI